MEQCRMHSQQFTHNAPDPASFDILHSSFYPSYSSEPVNSKVMQAPRHPPPYVQRQFSPDSGASLKGGGSPPLPGHIHEQPNQGHSRFSPPSPPEELRLPVVYPLHLQHDNVRHGLTSQGFFHQLPRPPSHHTYMLMNTSIDTFPNDASPQPMPPRGVVPPVFCHTYPLHPQPVYPLTTSHHPAPTHLSPEHLQLTVSQGPPTFPEQHEVRVPRTHGQSSRSSWGGPGSLDLATGVYSRASDHPRIRTAQACEKCRLRKAKCSGDHPICQRCHDRGLECKYAAERRMRGPNKPKPPFSPLVGSPRPAAMEGQKTRKRASTMPSGPPRRGMQVWNHHQKQNRVSRGQQQEGIAAAASPASPTSSTGSGSLGFQHLSESEASPMTPHSSLGRRSASVSFPASPRILLQEFTANMRPGVLSHVSEGHSYVDEGALYSKGMVAGAYGQNMFPGELEKPFENK